jgi:hypothetical protein
VTDLLEQGRAMAANGMIEAEVRAKLMSLILQRSPPYTTARLFASPTVDRVIRELKAHAWH